jgi:RHH-type rel operon transcriptional repressor/antitoxin RelB
MDGAPMLVLHLPPDIEARLAGLARRTRRTKSQCACDAIVACIDDLEDLGLARRRYELIEKGKSRTLSLEYVQASIAVGQRDRK